MLLNNFIASLYPNLKGTTATGILMNSVTHNSSAVISRPPGYYSETISDGYPNMFSRGIVFGSGTTPPKKNRL